MKRTLLVWLLVALPLGCGGGGGGGLPPDDTPPEPQIQLDSATTAANGQVSLSIGDQTQVFEVRDAATDEPVPGIEVYVGDDGEDAVLVTIDPLERYESAIKDPTVSSGAASASVASKIGDWVPDLVEFVYVVLRNAVAPPRPVSLEEVDGAITREILRSFYWKTVSLSELDSAFADWLVPAAAEGATVEAALAWGLKGTAKNSVRLLSYVATATDLTSLVGQSWAADHYLSRCYDPSSQIDLYILLGGAIIWALPVDSVEPPAPEFHMTLVGTVRDADTGLPLAGVHLRADPQLQNAWTDENGYYEFQDLAYGCANPEDVHVIASKHPYPSRSFSGSDMGLERDSQRWFDFCMGDGPCLGEFAKVPNPGGADQLMFGKFVALTDSALAVSAHSTNSTSSGKAYVFEHTPGGWNTAYTFPGDHLYSDSYSGVLAGSGDRFVLGDWRDTHAHLLSKDAGGWSNPVNLEDIAGSLPYSFGFSVAIDGDRAVVGAPNENTSGGAKGAVYAFLRDAGGWSLDARLVLPQYVSFGVTIAINGDILAATSSGPVGSVHYLYVYRRSGGSWVPDGTISFGPRPWAVLIHDGQIITGSHHDSTMGTGAGAIRVFKKTGEDWVQSQVIYASDAAAGDGFAGVMAVHGSTLVVGAPGVDVGADENAGAIYLFSRSGSQWSEDRKITAPDPQPNVQFGYSVAISAGYLAVGSIRVDGNGAAYVAPRD